MKVKIGNKTYDGNKEPIMLILDSIDKENIHKMAENANKFCIFPDHWDRDEIDEFMEIE